MGTVALPRQRAVSLPTRGVRLRALPVHVAVAQTGGVRVFYNQPLNIPANTTQSTARDLGTVVHLALPTLCLALSGWAIVARYSRAAFRSVLGREFLSVVRAKGLSRLQAHLHLAANTAVPFVTLLATIVPGLVGGSIIVEQVFSLPGVGRLYLAAVEARDYPVVLALTLLSAVLVLAGHLLVDLLYLLVDPRIRTALLPERTDAI